MIALVGRSNVGKSSMINTLSGRREMAKTSATPGKTLTCNFYLINESFYLVDLPGYGYAKVSRVTRERIQTMVDEFFTDNTRLKGIIQIMDLRHPPTNMDVSMFNWIRGGGSRYLPLVTKADKLGQGEMHRMFKLYRQKMDAPGMIVFSAKTGQGKDDLLDAVRAMINDEEFAAPRMRMPDRGAQKRGRGGRDRQDGRRDDRDNRDNRRPAPKDPRPSAGNESLPGSTPQPQAASGEMEPRSPRDPRPQAQSSDQRPRPPQDRRPQTGGRDGQGGRPGRGDRPQGSSHPRPQNQSGDAAGRSTGQGDQAPERPAQGQGGGRRHRRPHHRRPDRDQSPRDGGSRPGPGSDSGPKSGSDSAT